jgi:hypothetical protein
MGRFQMYRNIQHTLLKLGLLVFFCHDSVQAQTGMACAAAVHLMTSASDAIQRPPPAKQAFTQAINA